MDIGIVITALKVVVLIGGLVAAWFGVMLLFFYERFAMFNELITGQYFVGKEKYDNKQAYGLDNWVLGWHTVVAFFCFLIAAWMFWTFYTYLSL